MADAGSEPDATRKRHMNTFISNMKADGLWQLLDVLWFTAAHSEAAALLNWVNANHTMSTVNEPTFTIDRGFAGNGVDSYVNTNYAQADKVNFLATDASFGCYTRDNNTTGFLFGETNTRMSNSLNGTSIQYTLYGGFESTNKFGSLGLTSIKRTGTALRVYQNGVEGGSDSTPTYGYNANNLYLCGYNVGGTLTTPSTSEISFAYTSGHIDATGQANLFTHVEAYLDAIGAGVMA